MYAMQYEITLPSDYDMGIIRERVRSNGPALDDFAGLGLKAYLIRERGTDESPVNEYAPFYLWASIDGMNRFLWGGGGFGGIRRDFGRPTVRHWTGIACTPGPAATARPRTATRHTEQLPADADPEAVVADALAGLADRAASAGVHSTALALDPQRWELLHFTLWTDPEPDALGTRYQVLHVSAPDFPEIAVGKRW